jgi:hypothetical protein
MGRLPYTIIPEFAARSPEETAFAVGDRLLYSSKNPLHLVFGIVVIISIRAISMLSQPVQGLICPEVGQPLRIFLLWFPQPALGFLGIAPLPQGVLSIVASPRRRRAGLPNTLASRCDEAEAKARQGNRGNVESPHLTDRC